MTRTIEIVVVDDHAIVRDGLCYLIDREPDMRVVGRAGNADDGFRLIELLRPDIAVIDYRLPGRSGVELCALLSARYPEIGVVMLTGFVDDQVIRRSIEAGAKAYVVKDIEGAELKRAIRAVAQGDSLLDPKATGRVMRWAISGSAVPGAPLTRRERDVLRLVAEGDTNIDIASKLQLSENSVKTYLSRAMRKLACNTRTEAATVAQKRGLL